MPKPKLSAPRPSTDRPVTGPELLSHGGSIAIPPEWPAHQTEARRLEQLVPYARNARTHTDEQVGQIMASMREWGFTIPVLVDESDSIICGHGRVLAAQRLGYEHVPVMVARGWSDAKKRAYILADNKLALNAGWNDELLRLEISDLADMGFDIPLLGWSDKELDKLMGGGKAGLTDPDAVPEEPLVPSTLPGDLWQLGGHRVICGDATDAEVVGRLLAGVKPHLMVTDPPYGVSYDPSWRNGVDLGLGEGKRSVGKVQNDDRADWAPAWALFPGDVAYVWHGGAHADTVAQSLRAERFEMRSQIIWVKQHFVVSRGDYHWMHEPCWYAVRKGKTGHYNGDRKQTTVWEIKNNNPMGAGKGKEKTWDHGTQKPVECMRKPIENNSSAGQAVYDPFLGSGTTLIAAEMMGRIGYGCELNPVYCDVIIRRWQEFTGEEARLEGTGETYEAVQARRLQAPTHPETVKTVQ